MFSHLILFTRFANGGSRVTHNISGLEPQRVDQVHSTMIAWSRNLVLGIPHATYLRPPQTLFRQSQVVWGMCVCCYLHVGLTGLLDIVLRPMSVIC